MPFRDRVCHGEVAAVTEKLLNLAIQVASPEVEGHRQAILRQQCEQKRELRDIENDILDALATSKGRLLENQELLRCLKAAKDRNMQIRKDIEALDKIQKEVETTRDQYRPAAKK